MPRSSWVIPLCHVPEKRLLEMSPLFRSSWRAAFASFMAGGALLLISASVRAELPAPEPLPIAKVKGWELTLDGRMSAFVSFSRGEPQPPTTALWQGFDDKPDS